MNNKKYARNTWNCEKYIINPITHGPQLSLIGATKCCVCVEPALGVSSSIAKREMLVNLINLNLNLKDSFLFTSVKFAQDWFWAMFNISSDFQTLVHNELENLLHFTNFYFLDKVVFHLCYIESADLKEDCL